MRRTVILTISMLLLLLISFKANAAQTSTTVTDFDPTAIGTSGKILLPDGMPAEGAVVSLDFGTTPCTSTTVNKSGDFALRINFNLFGPYNVQVDKPGYAQHFAEFDMFSTSSVTTLRPLVPSRAASGSRD